MRAIDWGGKSATAPRFLEIVKNWIEKDGEVYLMLWFHCAGGTKHHWLLNSFAHFLSIIEATEGYCSVDVYRHPNFPLRGVVDDAFIRQALVDFPDGENWFLLAYEQNSDQGTPCDVWGDNSHTALLEALNSYIGDYVFVGPDVHWPIAPDDYPGEWISSVLNAPSEDNQG